MAAKIEYQIRYVVEKDMSTLLEWFYDEGWENGCFVLKIAPRMKHCRMLVLVDSNDIPLAYLSYAEFKKYVHIGGYIVDPKYRGQGIGSLLWNHVMNKIGMDTNVYLKSAAPMTEKYRTKSNFSFFSPIKYGVCSGLLDLAILEETITNEQVKNACQHTTEFTVDCVFNDSVFGQLVRYDAQIHGETNSDFLSVWLKTNSVPQIFTVYAKNSNEEIVGYGSIVGRDVGGRRICPLFADSFLIFLLLLKRLLRHYFVSEREFSENVSMTIPSSHTRAIEFFLNSGFLLSSHSVDRVFTKKIEEPMHSKIYCLTSCLGVPE